MKTRGCRNLVFLLPLLLSCLFLTGRALDFSNFEVTAFAADQTVKSDVKLQLKRIGTLPTMLIVILLVPPYPLLKVKDMEKKQNAKHMVWVLPNPTGPVL